MVLIVGVVVKWPVIEGGDGMAPFFGPERVVSTVEEFQAIDGVTCSVLWSCDLGVWQ